MNGPSSIFEFQSTYLKQKRCKMIKIYFSEIIISHFCFSGMSSYQCWLTPHPTNDWQVFIVLFQPTNQPHQMLNRLLSQSFFFFSFYSSFSIFFTIFCLLGKLTGSDRFSLKRRKMKNKNKNNIVLSIWQHLVKMYCQLIAKNCFIETKPKLMNSSNHFTV